MVEKFKFLDIEDNGKYIICHLSNPPSHTLTSGGVEEIHKFLDIVEQHNDLRVLAFTGSGQDVFIKHYEVGELADTAEKNISKKKSDQSPLPETSVGILPGGGGTQRLSRLIGSSRALDLILHAKLLTPQEAFELGIINRLVSEDNFLNDLHTYCQDLASRAPIALGQVKKIIHQGLDMSLEESLLLEQEAFNITMNSKDAARAMRSLLNSQNNIEEDTKFEWKGE